MNDDNTNNDKISNIPKDNINKTKLNTTTTYRFQKPSTLNLVSSIIGLILISQFIVLGVVIKVNLLNIDYTYSDNFGNNWDKAPVDSFTIRPENELNSNCPTGSSYLLSNVKFPGFNSGCFCPPNKLYDSECTQDQLQKKDCKFFPESAPQQIYSWGGTFCGFRNTGKRFNSDIVLDQSKEENSKINPQSINFNYFYFNRTDATKNEECKEGFKECGILDTLGNKLCVQEYQYCPVNYIEIRDNKEDNKEPDVDFPLKKVSFNNNKKTLYYSNDNVKGNIVNEFIVLDHIPCADAAENKIKLNTTTYTCQNTVGNTTVDENWKHLDDSTIKEFIHDNGLDVKMTKYPFYNNFKDRKVSLYYRSYIGLNQTCTNMSNTLYNKSEIPKLFLNFEDSVNHSHGYDFLSPASIVLFIIIFLSLVIKIYLTCNYEANYNQSVRYPNRNIGNYNSYILYINTISAVSCILLLIISLVSTISIGDLRNTYIWFSNFSNCSDQISQELLALFDSRLRTAYTLAVVFTLFNLILFFLVMIESFLKHCTDEVPDFEEENDFLDNNNKPALFENENLENVDNNLNSNTNNNNNNKLNTKRVSETPVTHNTFGAKNNRNNDNNLNNSINDIIDEDNDDTKLVNKKNK